MTECKPRRKSRSLQDDGKQCRRYAGGTVAQFPTQLPNYPQSIVGAKRPRLTGTAGPLHPQRSNSRMEEIKETSRREFIRNTAATVAATVAAPAVAKSSVYSLAPAKVI